MLVGAHELRFWKVQSIGNHFPLVLSSEYSGDLSALAIQMCRDHFGIGGDGLLAVGVDGSDLVLRMFNPDGTEDFCGNGLRCAARFAFDQGLVGSSFNILHLGRTVPVMVDGNLIKTVIGTASYEPKDVPTIIAGELFDETIFAGRDADWSVVLSGSALSTGSTHVVLPVGSLPDDDGFRAISSRLEVDPRFPQRTSVIWAARDGEALKLRIWERGVGETLGCGTGSSAAAVDWMRRRKRGGRIEVKNPGGTVGVSADTWSSPITLEGEATTVFQGDFPI